MTSDLLARRSNQRSYQGLLEMNFAATNKEFWYLNSQFSKWA